MQELVAKFGIILEICKTICRNQVKERIKSIARMPCITFSYCLFQKFAKA